jgi:hypothetical protein
VKQWLAPVLGAGLLIAGPALAGDPRGGHGGGHPPAPPPSACCHGGGNTNVNINVNASASASAYAGAGGYINARGYDFGGGGYRGGGGVIYTGGGYGGDAGGGYYGGGPVYAGMPNGCGAPPSAPFGYAVSGMGRDYRNAPMIRPEAGCPGGGTPPPCQSRCESGSSQSYEVYYEERSESGSTWTREDRGGRYGDSRSHEQQDRSGGRHPPAPTDGWVSYGCGCVSSGRGSRPYGYDHDGEGDHRRDGDHAPPHTIPAPHYEPPPVPQPQPQRPPRQQYRHEPGERG